MAQIDDNIEEFAQLILNEVNYLDKGIDGKFANLVLDIKEQLYNGDYRSRTGNLRRSIQVKYVEKDDEKYVVIQMTNYGFFISFGVNGFKRRLGIPINEAVAGGDFKLWKYKPGHIFGSLANPVKVPGIRPRKFYPLDVENRIMKILTNE